MLKMAICDDDQRELDKIEKLLNVHDKIKYQIEELCCKGWMSNPLLRQQDSQIIRSRMKRLRREEENQRINRQAA